MNWKKLILWIAVVVAAVVIVAFVGGYAVLHSGAFHRYVLAKITQQAETATGGQVQVKSFNIHPSSLTASVYGLIIHGTEGPEELPLLTIDEVSVRFKIISLLQRKIGIQAIAVRHPVAHLIVNRQGQSNVPKPAAKPSNSQVDIFKLAIGHVLLTNGEIYYNNRKSALQADVYNFKTNVAFNSVSSSYRGSLGYTRGKLQLANYTPLPHSLHADFVAAPDRLDLAPVEFAVGSSRAALQLTVTDYSNPVLGGSYKILIHTQDFASLAKTAEPAGNIALSGTLHYQSSPNHSMLRDLLLRGNLDSRELRVRSSQLALALQNLRGAYQIANGNLEAHGINADLLNGHLTAELRILRLDSTPSSQLQAGFNGISISAARSAGISSIRQVPLSGTVDGTATASWTGNLRNLVARSDVIVRGDVLNMAASSAPVPVNGSVHVGYDGLRHTITVQPSMLRIPSTSITAQGMMSKRSNLRIQATTTNLHELAVFAAALRNQPSSAASLNLQGTASINALVQGTLQEPRISAQVLAPNLELNGSRWRTVQISAVASRSSVTIQHGSLVGIPKGQITFRGSVDLHNWSYSRSNPIAAQASITQLPVSQLQRLAKASYPVTGILTANVSVRGSQLNPVGNGLAQLNRARIYGQPLQAAVLQFQATGTTIVSSLKLATNAGAAMANVTYHPQTRAYQLQVNAPGIALQQLELVKQRNIPVAGTLTAHASGAGTLDNPQLTATVQVPELQVEQTRISSMVAQLQVLNHRAQFALNSGLAQSFVQAKATVDLRDGYTVASLDTSRLPLQPLLAAYVTNLPTGAHADLELHASLRGPLKNRSQLQAQLVIPTFTAGYEQLQVGNVNPIRVNYANSVVTIEPSELKGTDTDLQFQGRIPLQQIALTNITARGNINMRLLQIFSPDVQSSGTVALDLHTAAASPGLPQVQGQIRLQKVSVTTGTVPVGLENLNGVLALANNQIHIEQLDGQSGGGQVSIGGTIVYRPQLQFNIALKADSVRVLYSGIRTTFGGNVALSGSSQAADLNGRMLIQNLSFTPDFDLASFMTQTSTPSLPPAQPTFADRLKLHVTVQTAAEVSAINTQVSIEGQANLQVVGSAANPVITGRTDLTSGEVFFMKQRYQLERGIINFINPNRTEPEVNILMTTTIQQYQLSLTVVGPVNKLRTTYRSQPPLPPVDIIRLIAGQAPQETGPSTFSANEVLAGELASQVSTQIAKLAGISSLTIDPLLGGNNQNPSARVAIQQRVTKNFIFTFSTDVTNPQAEIVQGQYQINNHWSVSATRDQYGGLAFDGKYKTDF